MRRLLTLAVLLASTFPAAAAITYELRSETAGTAPTVAAVSADGPKLRLDVRSGDAMLFKSGAVVLSNDGGRTLTVLDPHARTYYVVDAAHVAGAAAGALASLGARFSAPTSSTRDLGDAGAIGGFAVRHAVTTGSCAVTLTALGAGSAPLHLLLRSESWSTTALAGASAEVFESLAIRTGVPELDRTLDAIGSATRGRFPLKQVTVMQIPELGMKITTTSSVTNVRQQPVAPALFAMPAGYKQVASPLDKFNRQ